MKRILLAAGLSAVFLSVTANSLAADWPEWRGANRDGTTTESVGWLSGEMKTVWRMEFGDGFSAVSVVGDRAYTMTSDGESEYLVCLDTKTGDEHWRQRTDSIFKDRQGGDGPRATPAVVDGMVYTISAHGKLHAMNADSGDPAWTKNLVSVYKGRKPYWGYSGSPLVIDNVVYAEAGGPNGQCFVAINAVTGDTVWTSNSSKPGYATPALMNLAGVEQLVFFPAEGAVGISLTGEPLWSYAWKTSYDVNSATPLQLNENRLLLASGYDKGTSVVEIANEDGSYAASGVWTNKVLKSQMASPVYKDGHIYGFDGKTLKCVKADTGEESWAKARAFGRGTLILANDKLVILGEGGNLAIADATPAAYNEHVHAMAIDSAGKGWTSPSLSNGFLFIRSLKEIACIDVR